MRAYLQMNKRTDNQLAALRCIMQKKQKADRYQIVLNKTKGCLTLTNTDRRLVNEGDELG